MSLKVVELSKTPLGGTRWIFNCPEPPSLGIAHFISNWMLVELLNGHVCTYHLNGRLVARSATYQRV